MKFPAFCVNLYSSVDCAAYVNHFKAMFASVGFLQWQNRCLPVGEYKVVCGKGNCQHWGRCARDPHMSVFIERNVAVMENYLWSPKWIWNITNVHLQHSHLPLKGIKVFLYITSSPLSTNGELYILHFKPLVLSSMAFWSTCIWCSESNWTKIVLRSQRDTALITAGQQQRDRM